MWKWNSHTGTSLTYAPCLHNYLHHSQALLDCCPYATFRGIDSHAGQVDRYNKAASERLSDDAGQRVRAIQGDLPTPSDALAAEDWFNFDVAVISMALHHVNDPIDMLRRLRHRTKPGGKLVVVEMTPEPGITEIGQRGHESGNKHRLSQSHHTTHAHSNDEMVEVTGGQKIWAGFTLVTISAAMEAAGFVDVEGRLHSQTFTVPEGKGHSGTKRLIVATGVA